MCKPHMHTAALAINVNLEKGVTIGVDDTTVNLPPVSFTPVINLPPVRDALGVENKLNIFAKF